MIALGGIRQIAATARTPRLVVHRPHDLAADVAAHQSTVGSRPIPEAGLLLLNDIASSPWTTRPARMDDGAK